ncbi:MAG TPA: tetratricopeptide repeat protein [Acidobacteriota bacterium]|nr:tetratricopeptide repeat protein [Acidobacteriota bacterium]
MRLSIPMVRGLAAVALFTGLLAAGCGSKAVNHKIAQARPDSDPGRTRTAAREEKVAEPLDYRAYNLYVNGLLYEAVGDIYNAAKQYRKALQFFPESQQIGLAFGRVLYYLREPTEALATLSKLEPQDVDVLQLTAQCYHQLELPDSVRSTYVRLVALDPDNTVAFSFLVNFYRQKNDLDSTIWAYESLIRLHPENFRHLNDLARLLATHRELERAAEAFRQSLGIESGPANVFAVIGLGELFVIAGQPDSAIATFKRGLELSPDNLVLHRELTGLYAQADSLYAALHHARKVATLAPMERSAKRRLGALYFAVDSVAVADSIFSSLVASGDRSALNHYYLGRIAGLNDNWEQARDEFLKETQLADTLDGSWLDLALAYRQLGRIDQEIEAYQTGLNRMRDETSAINLSFALGATYERAGRIEEAVATFEQIIAHDSSHSPSLNYLGYMLADKGERLEYARELIARALELSPDNAAYLDSYGWVYYRLGDFKEALKHLEKAVSLDTDAVIFDHLGDTHQALGDMAKAREWWQKALDQQPDNERIREKLDR